MTTVQCLLGSAGVYGDGGVCVCVATMPQIACIFSSWNGHFNVGQQRVG